MKVKKLLRELLFVLGLFANAVSMASAQSIVPAMQAVEVLTPELRTYKPFDVRLTFRKPYCVQPQSPRYAAANAVRVAGETSSVLTIYLSQLNGNASPVACELSQIVSIPGLPSGKHQLRFHVTDTKAVAFVGFGLRPSTIAIETGNIEVTVDPLPSEGLRPFLTCGDVNGFGLNDGECWWQPGLGDDISVPRYRTLEVDVGSERGYAFKAIWYDDERHGVPSAPLTTIFRLQYPQPFVGTFWTTSPTECVALRAAWGQPVESGCQNIKAWVLALKNGVCPIGASRVYRLFNPREVEHRYTQDEALVPFLVNLGFVSEGAVFCAPAR